MTRRGAEERVVAIANQKGGVGKTTTAINLGAALALADLETLIVDIDPQGNASTGLGIDKSNGAGGSGKNIYDALIEGELTPGMIRPTAIDKLKIIPSTTELYGAEVELVDLSDRAFRLRSVLESALDRFDFVLIDSPPALGLLTINALTAARSVLIPLQTEFYALEGLGQLFATIDSIRADLNRALMIEGILFTMSDARTALTREVIEETRRHYGSDLLETVIPRNVRLAEAASHGVPSILYDTRSKGAESYIELAREILRRRGARGALRREESGDEEK